MKQLIDRLEKEQMLPREDWICLLEHFTPGDAAYLYERARHVRPNALSKPHLYPWADRIYQLLQERLSLLRNP